MTLGENYKNTKDFRMAKVNFEKSILSAPDLASISYCYFKLGEILFLEENYLEAITNLEKRIEYYLKSIFKADIDVMNGRIQNKILGETYWDISICFSLIGSKLKADRSIIKSALCGYETAIDYCKSNNLDYEIFIDR